MAIIQVPAKINEPAEGGVRDDGFRHFRTMVRRTWGDEWLEAINLTPMTAIETAAPAVGQAEFHFRAGEIRREQAGEGEGFSVEHPHALIGWFVRIDAIGPDGVIPWWSGIFTAESVASWGRRVSGTELIEDADQRLIAFGMELLLDRKPIMTAYVAKEEAAGWDGVGQTAQISNPPTVNDRVRRGLSLFGNRSSAKKEVPWSEESDMPDEAMRHAYVFSEDGEVWTVRDFLEYAVAFHPPPGPWIIYSGQFGDLDNLQYEIRHEGLTHKQLLDRLVSRRRGYGWCLRWWITGNESDDAKPQMLHVFSQFGQDIRIDGQIFRGNQEQVRFDLDTEMSVTLLERVKDQDRLYDQIIVRGAPLLTCFTISQQDLTLEAGWTEDEETAYGAATEEERREPRYEAVYQRFRLIADWDWLTSIDQTPSGAPVIANPNVTEEGRILTGQTEIPAPLWRPNREFASFLPILTPQEDGAAEYEVCPLVLVLDSAGSYRRIERSRIASTDPPNGNVKVLSRDSAFLISIEPNHVLGLNHYTAGGGIGAIYDWQEMLATVAMRTDTPVQVVRRLTAQAGTQQARTLLIEIPEAQMWYLVPGTVTGVESGEAIRSQDGGLVRDDSGKLRTVAAIAAQWFKEPRRAVRIQWKRLWGAARVGQYITFVGRERIGTCITRIVYDFAALTTTVETGYSEFDPSAYVPFGPAAGYQREGRA